jgi:hypothetical protein
MTVARTPWPIDAATSCRGLHCCTPRCSCNPSPTDNRYTNNLLRQTLAITHRAAPSFLQHEDGSDWPRQALQSENIDDIVDNNSLGGPDVGASQGLIAM